MLEGTEAITRSALVLALDAATMRHQVIAGNIANANAEGYAARRADFDGHLREARKVLEEKGRLDASAVNGLATSRVAVELRQGPDGRPQPVRLDEEMADMAHNAVHYQTLVRALSRHLSLVAMAAADGKR